MKRRYWQCRWLSLTIHWQFIIGFAPWVFGIENPKVLFFIGPFVLGLGDHSLRCK